MTQKLDWSEKYCVEKFLPLLTKWHLQDHVPCRTIKPIAIKKKRNPRGIPSYEVIWGDIDGQYEALIPDDQFDEEDDITAPWTTIERQDLMRQFYSDLVVSYEESIKKPPKEKKARGKKKTDDKHDGNKENSKPKRKYTKKKKPIEDLAVQTLNNTIEHLNISSKPQLNSSKSLNVSVSVNRLKRKLKNTSKIKTKNTIESYLIRKKVRLSKSVQSLERSFKNLSLIDQEYNNINVENSEGGVHFNVSLDNEKENMDCNNILDAFNGTKENSCESDLSNILDQIISKAPVTKTAKVDSNLVKLIFNKNLAAAAQNNLCDNKSFLTKYSSTPRNSLLRKSLNRNKINIDKLIMGNNCSTPNSSPLRRKFIYCNTSADNLYDSLMKKNTSNFFDKLTEDRDAFEMSVENIQNNSVIYID